LIHEGSVETSPEKVLRLFPEVNLVAIAAET
jgi:hypothetical protein